MRRRLAVLAAGVLLLPGCGGDGYDDPADLAQKVGCHNLNDEVGAVSPGDVATCDYRAETITLVIGSESDVDATVALAQQIASGEGVPPISVVAGDGWAVLTETRAAAVEVREKAGGRIR